METKDNTGALFTNKNQKTEKHPDYTGSANVNGKMMNISAWVNTAKSSGVKYLRLKFDDFQSREIDNPNTYESTASAVSESEVPF